MSVIAVKIQLSSPSAVRRSFSLPGIRSIMSGVTPATRVRPQYHFSATLIGVVRHDVNRSAGSAGFVGSTSSTSHAANKM